MFSPLRRACAALIVVVALAGCGGSSSDAGDTPATSTTTSPTPETDPSTAPSTGATNPPAGPTTTTPSPEAEAAQAGVLTAADLGAAWTAGTYDPDESGSPCGDTNTDADIPVTAKVGSIASLESPQALFQEDIRVYADAAEAGRAFAGLLSEVDCSKGSADDGNGGKIVIDIGPSIPLPDLEAPFDEGLSKTFSTTQYDGTAALVRTGSRVVTVRYLRAKGAPTTGLRSLDELLELSLARLAPR
ncbi:MAG: hypothetical protein JWM47_3794 [Acidimicrobiales bacterium]|nr:hypothetical protein [Acidimicrobiales bacterium]